MTIAMIPRDLPAVPCRVMLLGATGSIGRATAAALVARGHRVVCPVRDAGAAVPGAELRRADVTDPASLARDAFRGERFDAVVSCLASRSGVPRDAWAVDHGAHLAVLRQAQAAGVGRFVLLSAICVQQPELAFQEAKLAFEAALRESGIGWTVVRATAFFKSLSGQVARVMAGRPFLVFGDGRMTACKPISDADLGRFLALCLDDPDCAGRVLPVGGPGPAITPVDQVAMLSDLLGREVAVKRVPLALLGAIIGGLSAAGVVVPRLRDKAELARIGRYYATHSMLVWDAAAGRYDAAATPEFGADTLRDHYARMIRGEVAAGLREHAVF